MVHLALHWKLRCIQDSSASEDENTPPKMLRENTTQDKITSKKSCGDKSSDDSSSTGTATPPWMSPGFTKFGYLKAVSNQPPASQSSTETEDSPLRRSRLVASHTASSSVLLNNTTPRPPPLTTARTEGTERRRVRREAAVPYARTRTVGGPDSRPATNTRGFILPGNAETGRPRLRSTRSNDTFVLARWLHQVAHLREQFNPLATVFPVVPNFRFVNALTRVTRTLAAMPL
ncbi:hypothetical protein F441_21921 [Phytophthora nicotianae CJ01A1]|uniref:Uncharacterized protein n=1 Tax=Phytophthora nicotianae CJ01A1 TaxID=1317063 RepID=W2VTR0_PHYNI|nr:hypothetical protein F441_21921 [Phytophthora nicotianae CJ01A1]